MLLETHENLGHVFGAIPVPSEAKRRSVCLPRALPGRLQWGPVWPGVISRGRSAADVPELLT